MPRTPRLALTEAPAPYVGGRAPCVLCAVLMRAARAPRALVCAAGEERQVFFVSLGGFDTHASELESVAEKFAIVNEALTAFVDEMKAQGVWEQVALLEASDFGRTLGSNGAGTDHACVRAALSTAARMRSHASRGRTRPHFCVRLERLTSG